MTRVRLPQMPATLVALKETAFATAVLVTASKNMLDPHVVKKHVVQHKNVPITVRAIHQTRWYTTHANVGKVGQDARAIKKNKNVKIPLAEGTVCAMRRKAFASATKDLLEKPAKREHAPTIATQLKNKAVV